MKKKLRFIGLLAMGALLALGLIISACSSDNNDDSNRREYHYYQEVSVGMINVYISNGGLAIGSVDPQTGDNYRIDLNGNQISRGRIEVSGIYIYFIPSSGDQFVGTLNGGVLMIISPGIPYNGGFIALTNATIVGGAVSAGGAGSTYPSGIAAMPNATRGWK